MKFSSIIKQLINFRNSLLEDGYHVDHYRVDNINKRKYWRFVHPNGHKRNIILDIKWSYWIVSNEHDVIIIKQQADAE